MSRCPHLNVRVHVAANQRIRAAELAERQQIDMPLQAFGQSARQTPTPIPAARHLVSLVASIRHSRALLPACATNINIY